MRRNRNKATIVRASLLVIASTSIVTFASSSPAPEGSFSGIWQNHYPGSSSVTNLEAGSSTSCMLCHRDPDGGNNYNAYGWRVREVFDMGGGLIFAFQQAEGLDSDGEGSTNLEEIDAGTQPGWTSGPNNTIFFGNGNTQPNQNPPASIVAMLDPATPVGTSSCFGDGGDQMGCTDCPCNNNAAPGSTGGCMNSAGTSTELVPSGSTGIAAADLRFEASGAPPNNSAVLTSGNALAPANMANPCFGLGSGIQSVSLDGLRCVVQGVLRHGVRPSDANGDIGVTTNGWGMPNGFFNFSAFVSGTTKHFQIIHRDDMNAVCMRGQNTSQAVSVSFTP